MNNNNDNFADVEAFLAHCRATRYDPVFNCLRLAPRFLPELLYMGYPTDRRNPEGYCPIHHAFDLEDIESARVLLNAGADPTVGSNGGITIMHLAAYRNRFDILLLALEVYPEGIHVGDKSGDIPLVYALHRCKETGEVSPFVRELVNSGSTIDNICFATAMKARSPVVWRYLVARGGRYKGKLHSPAEYAVMVDAVEACRRLAAACIGLGRVGGRVQGNGRDVLRLIAKEIWLTRMDEDWYRWNWEIRRRA